jgi:hypothetical protein
MLRLKVLHQYLASCVKLSVEPSEDVPAPEHAAALNGGHEAVQEVGAAGHWVSDRPGAKPRLHFVLAEPDGQQGLPQQQQHLRVADRDSDDAKKGGVFAFVKTARAAADAAAAEMTEDAAAAAAAVAATEGSVEPAGDVAAQQQDREQLQQLEQQLGGRLLSVQQMWQNMPLAVALQVRCAAAPPAVVEIVISVRRSCSLGCITLQKPWKFCCIFISPVLPCPASTAHGKKGASTCASGSHSAFDSLQFSSKSPSYLLPVALRLLWCVLHPPPLHTGGREQRQDHQPAGAAD